MNVRSGSRLLFLTLGLMLLTGCNVLPEAQTDPTRSFILSTRADAAPSSTGANAPTVHLRSIELASYLRTRSMIVRKGENEIEFREFAQWGEGLDLGIARVLREELLARGSAGLVQLPGSRTGAASNGPADVEVRIRVLACEGDSDGAINFRAAWELSGVDLTRANSSGESSGGSGGGGGASAAMRGDYRSGGLRWNPPNEASLAAGLSEAVAGLAAEISTALTKG